MADSNGIITPAVSAAPDVSTFDFNGCQVRIINAEEGTIWFCARDIANALGYSNSNKAIKDHCHGVTNRYPIIDALGRTQETKFITEGDVYRLIVSSKLPEAQKFEHWLFDEVVPTIRRTGGYNTSASLERLVDNPDMVIALAMKVKEERAARELAETALHDFTSPAGSYDLKTAAKILNRTDGIKTGANRLAKWLVANNWCYRQKDGKHDLLTPYQKTVEAGWLEVRAYKPFVDAKGNTHRSVQVRITGRGLNRIRLLMLAGVRPDVQSMVGGVAVDLFEEIEA